jgi:hypothetical protein
MIYIRTNNKRQRLFESRQQDVIDDDSEPLNSRIYKAVANGGIRWNSTYLMIERAILLKDAIQLYQTDSDAEFDEADLLTSKDWLQLSEMKALLEPITEASKRVQTKGTKHGALHETLTTMDYILTHLEGIKDRLTDTDSITWRTSVILG